jgi:nicotinamidase-related amidase
MSSSHTALIVIDIQNDYFPEGLFPLWNAEATLANIVTAIANATAQGVPIILVQHIADGTKGPAPFFNEGTAGVEIHPSILAAAPDAPIIIKRHADGFIGTALDATLRSRGITDLLVCGMMTQNCVTHTAISKTAEAYTVAILPDCCTTVSALLHAIALNAVSTRLSLTPSTEALGHPA